MTEHVRLVHPLDKLIQLTEELDIYETAEHIVVIEQKISMPNVDFAEIGVIDL